MAKKAKPSKALAKVESKEANKKITEAVSTEVVIASLEKKAASAITKLKKITAVKTQADFALVGEQIKILKNLGKIATAEEKSMTGPLDLALKRIKGHFKPFQSKLVNLETEYKSLMQDFLVSQTKAIEKVKEDFKTGKIKKVDTFTTRTNALQMDNSGAAKTRKVWKLFIKDPKKIPREYLEPDESAITAAFKEGKKVDGCEYRQVDNIAI